MWGAMPPAGLVLRWDLLRPARVGAGEGALRGGRAMVPSTKVSRLHTLFSIHNAATSENVVKKLSEKGF